MASRALRARRAIRSITFTAARFGGSATIPLATKKAAERLLFFVGLFYILCIFISVITALRNYVIT
jgi:hypothetical protein